MNENQWTILTYLYDHREEIPFATVLQNCELPINKFQAKNLINFFLDHDYIVLYEPIMTLETLGDYQETYFINDPGKDVIEELRYNQDLDRIVRWYLADRLNGDPNQSHSLQHVCGLLEMDYHESFTTDLAKTNNYKFINEVDTVDGITLYKMKGRHDLKLGDGKFYERLFKQNFTPTPQPKPAATTIQAEPAKIEKKFWEKHGDKIIGGMITGAIATVWVFVKSCAG